MAIAATKLAIYSGKLWLGLLGSGKAGGGLRSWPERRGS